VTDDLDGTAVDLGTEIVPAHHPEPAPVNLFRTDSPVEVLEKATEVATALATVIKRKGMVQSISGKEHVKVEGWQTLGAMLGVVPVVTWARPIPGTQRSYSREERGRTITGKGHDWEARVEARTLDGRVVGAAEAMCTRDEPRWQNADDYAVRSMAQTRATSKALASPLRFIVTLSGFDGTPAEEIPGDGYGNAPSRGGDQPPTDKQLGFLHRIMCGKASNIAAPTPARLAQLANEIGFRGGDGWEARLNRRQCTQLLDALKDDVPPDVPSDFPEQAPAAPSTDDDVPF
jgi:hypothetical protein